MNSRSIERPGRSNALRRALGTLLVAAMATGLTTPGGVLAQAPAETAESRPPVAPTVAVDPLAVAELQTMCNALAGLEAFTVVADVAVDAVFETGLTVQYERRTHIALDRAQGLLSKTEGDDRAGVFLYDGSSLLLYSAKNNTFLQVDAPADMDAALELARNEYNVEAPLADLFYTDPCRGVVDTVERASVQGMHTVRGQPATHLAFGSGDFEWQIWLQQEGPPLPLKLVITDHTQTASPQYMAWLRDWDLAPELTGEAFVFTPPADAERIQLAPQTTSQTNKPATQASTNAAVR